MIRDWFGKIRLIVALSPQKLGLLLFIVVSLLSLVFQVAGYLLEPSYMESDGCKQQKATIIQQITKAGQCNTDADCTLLKAPCPFNCSAVHKGYEGDLLLKQMNEYTKNCGRCVPQCIVTSPVCVNHQCGF